MNLLKVSKINLEKKYKHRSFSAFNKWDWKE